VHARIKKEDRCKETAWKIGARRQPLSRGMGHDQESWDPVGEMGHCHGGAKVVEGALFKATYIESNRSVFDKDAFINEHGADVYAKFTKTSAVFSVKVTSK
jgi:hypothetical protein